MLPVKKIFNIGGNMKKILKIILLALIFLCFICFKGLLNLDVYANNGGDDFYKDFTLESIQKCYYCYEDSENWSLELSMIIYWGKTNGNDSYILYDDKNNSVIEFSPSSISKWDLNYNYVHSFIIFEKIIDGRKVYFYGGINLLSNLIFYYDSDGEFCQKESEYLFLDIVTQSKQNVSDSYFNLTENVIKKNSIDNDFYFTNLINNYGNNVRGSCSFVSTGILFSYVNEFIDNDIVPNNFELIYNNSYYEYTKEEVYEKSINNDFNISSVESPGLNEYFHQFLLNLYNENNVSNDGYSYSVHSDKIPRFIELYLNRYYTNGELVGLRYVSDYRKYYDSDLEYYRNECTLNVSSADEVFNQSYEYYEQQLDRSNLIREDLEIEYALDIFKEIDNGNPVLLIAESNEEIELNYEDYYGNSELKNIFLSGGHAMIAYGYVQTEDGIYYRCHYGNKMPYSSYNNNDIYFKSDEVVTGYVLKYFGDETNVESSSYYYDNGECLINLPTDEIYETYDEFVKNEGNVEFNNTTEYYYCNCEEKHLLYQCGHNYHYRKIDDSTHQKYCHCGHIEDENHTIKHTTSTTYDHYAYCDYCTYYDYFIDGITYYVGEDPYGIPEYYHTWSCSVCNLSGVYNHALEFESLGENYHRMNCRYCEYSDVAPHGCGYNVEIYYNKIGDNLHTAYCIGCKEEWIETHIGCNCHL